MIPEPRLPDRNPALPIEQRVADLLKCMRPEERLVCMSVLGKSIMQWLVLGWLSVALLAGCTIPASSIRNVQATFTPTHIPEITPSASDGNCLGDSNQPNIASGWKLLWQKTFELPIARPPVANGTQLFVLERSDVPSTGIPYSDTLWALNSETSDVQWKFGESQTPRQVMLFKLSPKYVASVIRKLTDSDSPPIRESTTIIERESGRILLSDLEIPEALSDEALYYRSFGRALNRIDLPTGAVRWYTRDAAESVGYLFADHNDLYAIGYDGNVYHYNATTGNRIASGTLGPIPAAGDLVVRGELAIVRSWHGFEGVTAFDLHTLKLRWATPVSYLFFRKSNAFGRDWPTFSATPEAVYLYDTQNRLLRIDLKTGQILWSTSSVGVQPMSAPVAVEDMLYGLFADGTVRAFSVTDGSSIGIVMKVPLWYWQWTDDAQDWRDRFGGLAQVGNTLIVTTGCRSVYSIQRDK